MPVMSDGSRRGTPRPGLRPATPMVGDRGAVVTWQMPSRCIAGSSRVKLNGPDDSTRPHRQKAARRRYCKLCRASSRAAPSAARSRSPGRSRPGGLVGRFRRRPLVREIIRAGATHLTLPLASKNPLIIRRNVARAGAAHPAFRHRHHPCAQPRPGMERLVGGARNRLSFRDNLSQRLRRRCGFKRRYNSVMARGERVIAISRSSPIMPRKSTGSAPTGCA